MGRMTLAFCLLTALGACVLWVAESRRGGGQTEVVPAAAPAPAAVPLELRGDLKVSAWVGDAPPNDDLLRQLREWLPASEVALRGDVAVVRWRETITAERTAPAGWAVLPLGQLRALVAVEAQDPSQLSTIEVDLRSDPAATLVSLDGRRMYRLPQGADAPQDVAGDLWIDPFDPAIAGIGSQVNGHRHVGDDTGVALLPLGAPSFEALESLPPEVHWQQALPEETIGAGAVFIARSSSGRVYKVRVDDLEKHGRRMRLSFARLRMP